jgi:hypothetical protein
MKSKKHTRVACKREGFDVGWEFDWKRFLVSFFLSVLLLLALVSFEANT